MDKYINTPWAIGVGHLSDLRLKKDRIRLGADIFTNTAQVATYDDLIVIDLNGILVPTREYYDEVGMDDIRSQITAAMRRGYDIILNINSPGDTVEGAFELANFIKESSNFIKESSNQTKIIAFTPGMMCSAGYLIASACDEIYISGETNLIGSIGVICARYDETEFNERLGFKIHEFVTGVYKNAESEDKVLTEVDAEYIQARIDYIYSIFVNYVSKNRGLDKNKIIAWEAKVFVGQQAIDNGLVDGILDLDSLINCKLKNEGGLMLTTKDIVTMSVEELKTNHIDCYNKIYNMGKEDGVVSEKCRILAIQSAAFEGQDELKNKLISDSKITAGEAALAFNLDQKTKNEQSKNIVLNKAPAPVVIAGTTDDATDDKKNNDFMQLVNDYKKENKCKMSKALSHIVKTNPESHNNFLKQKGGN